MKFWKKNIAVAKFGRATVNIIYLGAKIVWQAIRSCFGTGIWRPDKPWIGDDKWKNQP